MAAYFQQLPHNVRFYGVDLKAFDGLGGLNRLYRLLRDLQVDQVADLHDVLRTQYLRFRFWLAGKSVAHIHKGRKGKKLLTQARNKVKVQQKTSFARYAEVFAQLGCPIELQPPVFTSRAPEGTCLIGIAPFAAHAGKIYPLGLMKQVVDKLAAVPNVQLFLFGGGKKEEDILNAWAGQSDHIQSVAGTLSREDEITLMRSLQVMLSMDSANMHLASLAGVPVVSIWGATHPYAGFLGWGQQEKNAIQTDLPCRPCSIYGNKPCLRNDYACLNQIRVDEVVNRVLEVVGKG